MFASSTPTVDRPPRPRWHRIYYLLAAFDVLTVLTSLYLSSRIERIYTQSIAVNQLWAGRLAAYSQLGELAAAVNAPGNDIFDSRDVPSEAARAEAARRVFDARLATLRAELQGAPDTTHATLLLGDLDLVAARMDEMTHEAELIFTFFAQRQPDKAGERMATMDRKYANVNTALASLRAHVSLIQQNLFDAQAAAADSLRQFEYLIGTFVLLMVTGATLYGHKMARQIDVAGQQLMAANHATLRELDERALVETALRQSEARNHAILNAIPDAIFRIDQDGTLLDSKMEAGHGSIAPATTFVGRRIDELMPPDLARRFKESLDRTLRQHTIQILEYELPQAGAPCEYEARMVVSGEREVVVIVRDITERKQVDRLKNEFVSVVSHELRTPLTSIRGSLGLIVGGVTGEIAPQTRAMLDIAYKNSERLVRLVSDILDIEKIESGSMTFQMQPIALGPLVEQAIEANRAYGAQLGVTFALKSAMPGALVYADADRLMQVLTNLLSNAAKFSPPGATVDVLVTRRGDHVRIAVADHGPGIPEAFRGRIFQKFAQADSSDARQKAGTGLGLSIARAIVEKHGGKIGFETALGAGTTFFVDLREWYEPVARAPQLPLHGHILICEDDRGVATILALMLQQGGFTTDVAYDAVGVRQLLAQRSYDGMTLDLMLPDTDGLTLIRELRADERTRHLPIVVVSAKAEQGRREIDAQALGVFTWLEKPFDQTQLLAHVAQATRDGQDGHPRILHVTNTVGEFPAASIEPRQSANICTVQSADEARHQIEHERFDALILEVEPSETPGPAGPDAQDTSDPELRDALVALIRRGSSTITRSA